MKQNIEREDKKNMASSSEAFDKFLTWKKDRSSLKVTVIVNGVVDEVLEGSIFGADRDASQVGIVLGMHKFVNFDVEGSVFSVESTRVVATRNESDWIVFEVSA